jgi:hypothetical protein
MGNLAVAEELAGSDELEELYRLDASDTEPEEDEEDEEEEPEEEEMEPRGIPHSHMEQQAYVPGYAGDSYTETCPRLAGPNGARLQSA